MPSQVLCREYFRYHVERTSVCPLESKKNKSQGKKICIAPRSCCLGSVRIKGRPNFSLLCEVLQGQTIRIAHAVDT